RQSYAILEKLQADFPAMPEYAEKLGASAATLGNLLRDRGEVAASLAWYDRALAALRPVVAQEPRLVPARRFLRTSLEDRARALRQLSRPAEGIGDWEPARALTAALVADFPNMPAYRRELARIHLQLGLALADLRKWAEAEAAYHQALTLDEQLTAD